MINKQSVIDDFLPNLDDLKYLGIRVFLKESWQVYCYDENVYLHHRENEYIFVYSISVPKLIEYESDISNEYWHRNDGPAFIITESEGHDGRIEFYIGDYHCSFDEFLVKSKAPEAKKSKLALKYSGIL